MLYQGDIRKRKEVDIISKGWLFDAINYVYKQYMYKHKYTYAQLQSPKDYSIFKSALCFLTLLV